MKLPITCAVLAALGGSAHADNEKDKDRAEALFKRGQKLMSDKRFAEACPAFEQSYKLDPALGSELNIAKCYEDWGKLARAWSVYRSAEQHATEAHDHRATQVREIIDHLDGQVPRLTIRVVAHANTRGLVVTLDGAALDPTALGQPQIVDPGPHTIEYTSPGHAKRTRVVPLERGGSSEISLDPAKANGLDGTPSDGDQSDVDDPGRTQKIVGIAVGGTGVVAIGIASVMALSARSKYNDALANDCGGMTNGCNPAGLTETHDARHEANVATAVFLIGLAAAGGGVALYLLAPHASSAGGRGEHALYLVPAIGPDGGGLVFGGKL